jgi:hypothetical protein
LSTGDARPPGLVCRLQGFSWCFPAYAGAGSDVELSLAWLALWGDQAARADCRSGLWSFRSPQVSRCDHCVPRSRVSQLRCSCGAVWCCSEAQSSTSDWLVVCRSCLVQPQVAQRRVLRRCSPMVFLGRIPFLFRLSESLFENANWRK